MLEARRIGVRYGEALALANVDLDVSGDEVVAVVGVNGAGKSTFGKAISGLVPSSGDVRLDGEVLTGTEAHRRVAAGIVYVPEGRHVFTQLTVLENLRAGAFSVRGRGDWQARRDDLLDLLGPLAKRANVAAGLLSGGEQQMLAVARALMACPRLLVLDEPSLGLAPLMIDRVADLLRELRGDGALAMLLLEQNVAFASRLADRGVVLSLGRVARTVSTAHVRDADRLRAVVAAGDDAPTSP